MSPTPGAKAKSAAPLGVKSFQATQPNRSASSSANKSSLAPPAALATATSASTPTTTATTTTSSTRSALDLSEQLSSIRKLTEASKTADYLLVNTELNNNTLLAPYRSPSQSSYSIRMDYRQQQQQQQQKATGLSAAPPAKLEAKAENAVGSGEPGANQAQAKSATGTSPFQVPSYTSLFAPNSFRLRASSSPTRAAGPQQQQQPELQQPAEQGAANRRGSLKKQDQVDRQPSASPSVTYREARSAAASVARRANETSYAQASLHNDRLAGKKARANEHEEEDFHDEEEEEEASQIDEEEDEEEAEEDEVDERFPFSGSVASATRSSTRRSPESRTNRPRPAKPMKSGLLVKNTALGQQQKGRDMAAFSNKALSGRASTSPNPHTKISFNTDSRPPSFNTCQEDGTPHASCKKAHTNQSYAGSRTIDFYEEPTCTKCECVGCCKKKKSQILYQAHPNSFPPGHPLYIATKSQHAKTLALHLVLKSIILILLTVMLVGMMLGILAAFIYLPQMLDRFVSASKTFNVTIAG